MNFRPMLDSALSLSQTLSFTSKSMKAVAGVGVITTLAEVMLDLFGVGGDDGMADAFKKMGDAIEQHMDQLVGELKADMQKDKMLDATDVVAGKATELAQLKDGVTASTKKTPGSLDPNVVADVRDKMSRTTDGNSPISLVCQFARRCGAADHDYATLPLSLSATSAFLNYIKYGAGVMLTAESQDYLAKPAAQRPKVIPSMQVGEPCELSTFIYDILKAEVAWATPLVQALNKGVLDRQKGVDAALAPYAVVSTSNGYYTLAKNVSPNVPTRSVGANQYHGYGCMTQRNAGIINSLAAGTARHSAWVNGTADAHLRWFTVDNVYQTNYVLWNLNVAYRQHAELVGKTPLPPATLSGIYPPPPPPVPPIPPAPALPAPTPTGPNPSLQTPGQKLLDKQHITPFNGGGQ